MEPGLFEQEVDQRQAVGLRLEDSLGPIGEPFGDLVRLVRRFKRVVIGRAFPLDGLRQRDQAWLPDCLR